MDYSRAVAISAAGLAAEQARIEAATLNLANVNTSAPPGTAGYQPVTAVIRAVPNRFVQVWNGQIQPSLVQAQIVPRTGVAPRSMYEPGHPNADDNGMVSYPAIDSTQELMTVMAALRAYEANLSALQVTRMLAAKALEIGGA